MEQHKPTSSTNQDSGIYLLATYNGVLSPLPRPGYLRVSSNQRHPIHLLGIAFGKPNKFFRGFLFFAAKNQMSRTLQEQWY